jgi:3-phosphoglycerate kinase
MAKKITYIDEIDIKNKRILVRVDYNVSLNENRSRIANDARIKQSLPTIEYLLKHNNKLILVSHLDRPEKRDLKYSLKIIINRLKQYLPNYRVKFVDDFLTEDGKSFAEQREDEIILLENIRFYPEEKDNDKIFAQKLAGLADIYVNDAFAVSHRTAASIVGVPNFIPSYGGLLLKKETEMIGNVIKNPKRPFIVIIGGAKISTKIDLIKKLVKIADYVLLGGRLANVFFCAEKAPIGKSSCEYELVQKVKKLIDFSHQKHASIILPTDAIVGDSEDLKRGGMIKRIGEKIPLNMSILDIGPETLAKFGLLIAKAKTIIWNGPVGLFENPNYRQGTDFIYYSIAHNSDCTSIVGGGNTLDAISKKEYLDNITHISTGGGAMLEFIENGALSGIEALKR